MVYPTGDIIYFQPYSGIFAREQNNYTTEKEVEKKVEKLYSTTEAAEVLGISARRVAVLCVEGRFPGAQKIGNTWAIPESAIRNYTPGPPGRPKPLGVKDILREAGVLPPPGN